MARTSVAAAIAVVTMAGLAGCGSSSSNSGVCDRYVAAASSFSTKAAACLPATTIASFVPNNTAASCSAVIGTCSDADKQLISGFADCLNNLPTCSATNQQTWTTQASACGEPLSNLSAACSAAGNSGTTGGTGGGIQGSCSLAAGASCIDYSNVATAALTQLQPGCQQAGGTWSAAACPTANRVGTCSISTTGITQQVRVYTSAGTTAQQASSACTSGQLGGTGTWTNG